MHMETYGKQWFGIRQCQIGEDVVKEIAQRLHDSESYHSVAERVHLQA